MAKNLMLFSGNANPDLAKKVASELSLRLGEADVSKFSDGEINVAINENVRGKDVFIVQSTCAPTNDNLMELLILVDALRRASAVRITAVVPYFGYARQDRRVRSARVAITAKVVADMMVRVGVDRVLTVDLHAEQIQGFFDCPVDNVYGSPVLLRDIEKQRYKDCLVVSPDIGGVVRARAIAKQLDTDLAIIDKRRPQANVAEVMNIIGDVKGKTCILLDDIADSAGTLCNAAKALKDNGAKEIYSYIAHGVLSGEALNRIENSAIKELVLTDSIEASNKVKNTKNIRHISIAPLMGEAIKRINSDSSVSALFD